MEHQLGCVHAGRKVVTGVWLRSPSRKACGLQMSTSARMPQLKRARSFLGQGHILPGAVHPITSQEGV